MHPNGGQGRGRMNTFIINFAILDLIALIGLATWILPSSGAVAILGNWFVRLIVLFLLWMAVVVFLFVTCLKVA